MGGEPTILDLFLQASPLVKVVMALLVGMSVCSWMFIIQRTWFLRQSRQAIETFEDQFWSGTDLSKLYEKIVARGQDVSGCAHIFQSGFNLYKSFIKIK